jgi:hypothetical protein
MDKDERIWWPWFPEDRAVQFITQGKRRTIRLSQIQDLILPVYQTVAADGSISDLEGN